MARRLTHTPPGFAGGINYRDVPELVQMNQLTNAENLLLDERGGGTKRLGCTTLSTVGASGDRILSMYTWFRQGGLPPAVLVHLSDGTIRYTTNLTAWTTLWTGLSTTVPFCFEAGWGGSAADGSNAVPKVFMGNGVDDFRFWDGTTAGIDASAPRGKYLKWWRDTMWVAGDPNNPHKVTASKAGNAQYFVAAAFVHVFIGDGDEITGLWGHDTYLQVFKGRRRFIIADPALLTNRLIDSENGCESHFSIVAMRDEVYYLSRKGICIMNPNGPSEVVSDLIKPIFKDALSTPQFSLAWGYRWQDRVGWALMEKSSTYPSVQIEYYPQYEHRPWMVQRIPARVLIGWRHAGVERLLGGSNISNKLFEVFSGDTDDGAPISAFADTAWFDFGDPYHRKYFRAMKVLGRGQFYVTVSRDYFSAVGKTFSVDLESGRQETWNEAGGEWNEPGDIWGPVESLHESETIHPDLYGRFFSLRFADTAAVSDSDPKRLGSRTYSAARGNWAILGVLADGWQMGEII